VIAPLAALLMVQFVGSQVVAAAYRNGLAT
jgi:hypothetical protein